MNAQLITLLNSAADAWAAWMWPMTWHVTLLATVVAALAWLLRGRSARLRYALWLLIPIRLILPPTLSLATGWGWWLLPSAKNAEPPVAMSVEQFAPLELIASQGGPQTEPWRPAAIEHKSFDRAEQIDGRTGPAGCRRLGFLASVVLLRLAAGRGDPRASFAPWLCLCREDRSPCTGYFACNRWQRGRTAGELPAPDGHPCRFASANSPTLASRC